MSLLGNLLRATVRGPGGMVSDGYERLGVPPVIADSIGAKLNRDLGHTVGETAMNIEVASDVWSAFTGGNRRRDDQR